MTPTELSLIAKASRTRTGRNLAARWDRWHDGYAAFRRRQWALYKLWEKKADTRTKTGRAVLDKLDYQYGLEIKRIHKLKGQFDVLVSDLTIWVARQPDRKRQDQAA
jgi:hypothetical protein